MKKIFILLMALLMIAACLLMAGCKNKGGSDQKEPEETANGPLYYSRDSLYAYTLNSKNEATLVAYYGNAANVVLNRIDRSGHDRQSSIAGIFAAGCRQPPSQYITAWC